MKRISAILLSLVIAITVAGCGSNNSPQASSSPSASATPSQAASETPADPVELTFMVFETPNLTAAFWDNAIKKVTDKHPNIKIKKIVSPDIDRVKYAKQLLATGELPDVMIAVNPAEFASSGAMLPFEDEYLKAFKYPMANAIDGKQYQLPWNTQTYPNMFYNKKIFAEVGVQPPTTWAEFLDISDKIKKRVIRHSY